MQYKHHTYRNSCPVHILAQVQVQVQVQKKALTNPSSSSYPHQKYHNLTTLRLPPEHYPSPTHRSTTSTLHPSTKYQ
ncbi:hypothetical protein L873DRAFT_1815308 [Choiromyces venosus 120613-1]|uniref:Uncharacterized protein n=1 Tax=Choiromyces venosus 120613-1 TaxID=1336337 RepID=A0A3N4J654_9PEZI|nr:hypothetical protein L873DRAFT_1815308 [Choiromyces venosus 120613-1]